MRKLFSTDHIPVANRFRTSQEWNRELFGPSDLRRSTHEPFNACYAEATVGSISFCEFETSPVENTILPRDRSRSNDSKLILNMVASGNCYNEQLENNVLMQPDDMCLADNRYSRSCHYTSHSSLLAIMVPRKRLEQLLGPSRLYAGLLFGASLPSASLARSFFQQLLRVHDRSSPEITQRLTQIGIDLIIASISERMAMDTPKPLQGTVTVQRAKAYITNNLHDATLDPPLVAAAVGVSLRRLQQLFHDHGRHISDWIWHKRLELSAQRLADPCLQHLSINAVAYGCGFVSQTHFSRRFKDRYNMKPGDFRKLAMSNRANASSHPPTRSESPMSVDRCST